MANRGGGGALEKGDMWLFFRGARARPRLLVVVLSPYGAVGNTRAERLRTVLDPTRQKRGSAGGAIERRKQKKGRRGALLGVEFFFSLSAAGEHLSSTSTPDLPLRPFFHSRTFFFLPLSPRFTTTTKKLIQWRRPHPGPLPLGPLRGNRLSPGLGRARRRLFRRRDRRSGRRHLAALQARARLGLLEALLQPQGGRARDPIRGPEQEVHRGADAAQRLPNGVRRDQILRVFFLLFFGGGGGGTTFSGFPFSLMCFPPRFASLLYSLCQKKQNKTSAPSSTPGSQTSPGGACPRTSSPSSPTCC